MLVTMQASLFDGQSSARQPVEVEIGRGELRLSGAGVDRRHALGSVSISSRVGNTPRWIDLPGGGRLEVRDNDALDRALAAGGDRSRPGLHGIERRLSLVLGALVLTVAVLWAAIEYGTPLLARHVAHAIPREVDQRLGEGALDALDEVVLDHSTLDPEVRAALQSRFAALAEVAGLDTDDVRLVFRRGQILGANALALPSGIVVITDELVGLAAHEDEIVAVLAHELGHIDERHTLRSVLQNTMTPLLIASVTGDPGSIAGLAAALPTLLVTLKHSRAFELEADDYARDLLLEVGIEPTRLGDLLRRVVRDAGGDLESGVGRYLSTHPATGERMERLSSPGP